ncbi:MAG: serine/threonine protein kinase [Oscillospiraceae bacterium]|nr:serine/threonine protein kinase [Oscillospiraceae bacterium]
MLQIGSLVDNKYKILSEVGHGGMSVVYLAINERANKTWAVKEIRKDGVCDFEAVKQGLVVETDMLKKLNHQFLPSIIDVIDTEDSFLIVMDYIEGKSLNSVLKSGGAQPQDLVVKWGIQLCDVLGYLHSREPAIIYRDMKPANVMLRPNGDITLIDFGTAREFKNRAMVEDTTCLGTRGYAAPEQFGGRGQTDARTDIYCLGATLYHLITGHSPAEPPYEIKPLSYWDPSFYGSGIEQIIAKCCQQDPEHRYQSCAELMYDLENVHSLDLVTQRKRTQKWAAFVASAVMFGVGLLGVVGFSVAKNAAMTESYDYYISQAEMTTGAENFGTFVDYIKRAIDVDPGGHRAYDVLLSRIEEDGKFSADTEWSPLLECLNDEGEGRNQANDEYLKDSDTDGYADIQFRVGKLLFLMSEGNDADLRRSVGYFNKALNEGGMLDSQDQDVLQKANIASSLATIGSSLESLTAGSNMYTDQEYEFADLFEDLNMLVSNYSIDSMGGRQYGIALYNRVAAMMVRYSSEFRNDGISIDAITQLLDTLEGALTQVNSTLTDSESRHGFPELISNALRNVATARNNINALAGGVG